MELQLRIYDRLNKVQINYIFMSINTKNQFCLPLTLKAFPLLSEIFLFSWNSSCLSSRDYIQNKFFLRAIYQFYLFQEHILTFNNLQSYMGASQICCQAYQTFDDQSSLQSKVKTDNKYQYSVQKAEAYNVAPEALKTYKKLIQSYNQNIFLNIESKKNSDPLIKQLEDFIKVEAYDCFYNGQWKISYPHGRGRAIFSDSTLLIGVFVNGYCHSNRSFMIFKDGSYYQGSIIQNILSGKGKLTSELVQYEGNWIDNQPHGKGIQTFANGDKYIGEFQNGLKHGKNSLFIWKNHPNYVQYRGQFKQGKICGRGELTLKHDSAIVQGTFDQDKIADAVFACNRCRFQGNFKNGRLADSGKIEIYDLMETFKGTFIQGQLYGKCNVINSKKRSKQIFFFKGKHLRNIVNLRDEEVQYILNTIQKCYQGVQKHSDALIEINNQLNGYQCKILQPYQSIFNEKRYLTIEVFNKVLLIKSVDKL